MIESRFDIAPKDYTLSCSINFAECHEKQECRQENGISAILDFYTEPRKPIETTAKAMQNPVESIQEDSMQLPLSPHENGEIDAEQKTAIDIQFNAENSEIPQENTQNKPNISNFANARIF